jgi:hypothetical protein
MVLGRQTWTRMPPPAGQALFCELGLLFKGSHSRWQSAVSPAMISRLPALEILGSWSTHECLNPATWNKKGQHHSPRTSCSRTPALPKHMSWEDSKRAPQALPTTWCKLSAVRCQVQSNICLSFSYSPGKVPMQVRKIEDQTSSNLPTGLSVYLAR